MPSCVYQINHFPQAKQAILWLKCLLSGLEYLFSHNIVHRDLKLQNLLMCDNGLKICDFGLAIELDDSMKMMYTQGIFIVLASS